MKKIILVLPTLSQGGAERVMSELANEWASNGHNVLLVLLVKSPRFYKLDSKVELIDLAFDNEGNKFVKFIDSIKLLIRLRNLIKCKNPDFVLSFMDKYNVLTLIASFFLNVNIFVSDRNNPKEIIPKEIELLRKLLYRNAKGIIAQTSLAKEILFCKTNNSNIKVIPNPIKNFSSISNFKKEKIILNVGRLVPEKGQHYLIEVMAHLKLDKWKLIILGDGPLREELQKQIDDLNLNENVFLMGSVKNVDEWLRRSSIFAFTSISEGFPNALIEAMVAGLACVSFDCDAGPRDVLQDNINGYLIPLYDITAFKDVVQKLMGDDFLRNKIGLEARKVAESLSTKKIAQEYLNFCVTK